MVIIFDYEELQNTFNLFKPLPDVIHLTELIHILLINYDDCDRYQKAHIWQAIESSEIFNNEDTITGMTDEYLIQLDKMIELFSHELFYYLQTKTNLDVINSFVTNITFVNNSLVVYFNN